MKLTKERRKQFFTQYKWLYALPSGLCLMLYFYGQWRIRLRYELDSLSTWMVWGQLLGVALVVFLSNRVVDAMLSRYEHQWGGVTLTKMNRWAKYLWWLMMVGHGVGVCWLI
ncbi:hypothetical protein B0681_00830 [Moraxella porci DSM 25326]|uniref:Uncharacterized protein n=1 Tax=Moraxella porci DSM 25326 TaxID=573983 RepID=A0A1T0CVV9_9GAMM|nr:hypothetical protein [Moraxella porci]OOS26465.1 hypothetical protein B0681_00830 [Moraxella porci DSM 25326]